MTGLFLTQLLIEHNNLQTRHPRESGDPSKCFIKMDFRFRENDEFWRVC